MVAAMQPCQRPWYQVAVVDPAFLQNDRGAGIPPAVNRQAAVARLRRRRVADAVQWQARVAAHRAEPVAAAA